MEICAENEKQYIKLPLYYSDRIISCEAFKIILIEAGSAILCVNEKPIVVSAPAILCLNDREHLTIQKEEGLLARMLYFSPSIVNSFYDFENVYHSTDEFPDTIKLDHFYFRPFIERNNHANGMIEIGILSANKIADLLHCLLSQIEKYEDSYWPCRVRSYFLELLIFTQHCYTETDNLVIDLSQTDTYINNILLYLHLNYNKKITIGDITEEFHTNRNTLSMKFKKATGTSVVEYNNKLRVKVACMLLRDTVLPALEIMERVGFNDASYWGRTFKDLMGLSPSEYRKANKLV